MTSRLIYTCLVAAALAMFTLPNVARAQVETTYLITTDDPGAAKQASPQLDCPDSIFLGQGLHFTGTFSNAGEIDIGPQDIGASTSEHLDMSNFTGSNGSWTSTGPHGANFRTNTLGPGESATFEFDLLGVADGAATLVVGGDECVMQVLLGTVTGTKWEDLNGNGVIDGNEPGIAGWVFYLDENGNGVLDADERTTTSGSGGTFTFAELGQGVHRIHELEQEGWQKTFPLGPGHQVNFTQNTNNVTGANFGNRRIPNFIEEDVFEETTALIQLQGSALGPDPVNILLRGPAQANVNFDGPNEGDAEDDDGDGREEVQTELVELSLTGTTALGQPVSINLNPNVPSVGEIEESSNDTPGILDLPPFTEDGTAESFFDVFFEVNLDGEIFHNGDGLRIESTISHKPPISRYIHVIPEPGGIELLTSNNQPSGIFITRAEHFTGHIERDIFEETRALVQLTGGPLGSNVLTSILTGPSQVDVYFEGAEGDANDDDDNGRDEVETQLVSMDLTGDGVQLRLREGTSSPGQIEEQSNGTPGLLDLPPFTANGTADSFFDVFVEIDVPGAGTVHNGEAVRIESVISEKPPFDTYIHLIPPDGGIELLDGNGQPTGIRLIRAEHFTGTVEIDEFENTGASIDLNHPDGTSEHIELSGPSIVHVFFEGQAEGDVHDDDGDGLEEVRTELVQLELTGTSDLLGPVTVRLDPTNPSIGEIEETVNTTPGVLDVPPFTPDGLADSFFDVFFEVEAAGTILHTEEPKRMRATINNKPPGPGTVYEDPQIIPLLDENGQTTGFSIGNTRHTPVPPEEIVEHDVFEETSALVQLVGGPFGGVPQAFILRGSAAADVFFEGGSEGIAHDDDGDGLDEVQTELVGLDLTGSTEMGPVVLRLREGVSSPGEIREQVNNTPGLLDVPPFTENGVADSFFDVFFEIAVGSQVVHNESALRIESVISHKPPSEKYVHLIPEDGQLPLFDPNGNDTGIRIVRAEHFTGFLEIDEFSGSRATLDLIHPDGAEESVVLDGLAVAHVYFDGPNEGDADDDDGNGLDEVETEMVQLELNGTSSLGPLVVRVSPFDASSGVIEESVNTTPGTLDLPPFADGGTADSFFDIWIEVEAAGMVLYGEEPKRMRTTLTEKPPGLGTVYEDPQIIRLLDEDGQPTGFSIGKTRHVPVPEPVEIDVFEETTALLQLEGSIFTSPVSVLARGRSEVHVFFEGDAEGDANDDDGNGLEEVVTELVALDLTGSIPELGDFSVNLRPSMPSLGEIEETENATPGVLDVPPFTDTGTADSFFDVFFEITVGDLVLHNRDALFLQATIDHKPPTTRYVHLIPPDEGIELFSADGTPSGIFLTKGEHYTGFVERDDFGQTAALVQLVGGPIGDRPQAHILTGPTTVDVFFERGEGDADDDDENGLDEVETLLRSMNLTDGTLTMTLNPDIPSPGQIEEKQNNNSGRLDLDPFHPGDANSFFDVFFQIDVGGGLVVHNEEALRIEAMIGEKPPYDTYIHLIPPDGQLALFDPNGNDTGVRIIRAEHFTGFLEIDEFEASRATLDVIHPDGTEESIELTGPSIAHVFFDGPNEGDADDDDENGLDEVETEMVQMELSGTSPLLGPLTVRVSPFNPSRGVIEESVNTTPGTLDLPPFADGGTADSFFDVWIEVEVADMLLYGEEPKRMRTSLTEKPPGPGTVYEDPQIIRLLDPDGQPTGFSIGKTRHVPVPEEDDNFVEHDIFEMTTVLLQLQGGEVGPEPVPFILRGPTQVDVTFDGPNEGDADDDDGDGLDDVDTEIVSLDLRGGGATMTLNPDRRSAGQIEEQANNTPGRLDLDPFHPGNADSFFDVYFQIDVAGRLLHNVDPFRIEAEIAEKPPIQRYIHIVPPDQPVELHDEQNNPSGIFIVEAEHFTGLVEDYGSEGNARATLRLRFPNGEREVIVLSGTTTVWVFFEGPKHGDARDESGTGLDDLIMRLAVLHLTGNSSLGPVELRLYRPIPSMGGLIERTNMTPGLLDVPPFASSGQVDSFFDIFFEVSIGGAGKSADEHVLHNEDGLRLSASSGRVPPASGTEFTSDDEVVLLDEDGQPSGYVAEEVTAEPELVAVAVEKVEDVIPTEFELAGNYPNPFSDATVIPFGLPETLPVRIEVFDVLGRRVDVLIDEVLAAGRHELTWQPESLPSGIYVVRMTAGDVVRTQRITRMR